MNLDPTCDVISGVQINFATYSEVSSPKLTNVVLRSRIGPSIGLADIRGRGETPPPPSAGRVREYSIRARINLAKIHVYVRTLGSEIS